MRRTQIGKHRVLRQFSKTICSLRLKPKPVRTFASEETGVMCIRFSFETLPSADRWGVFSPPPEVPRDHTSPAVGERRPLLSTLSETVLDILFVLWPSGVLEASGGSNGRSLFGVFDQPANAVRLSRLDMPFCRGDARGTRGERHASAPLTFILCTGLTLSGAALLSDLPLPSRKVTAIRKSSRTQVRSGTRAHEGLVS